jgi:apolipoprotein N-acyltransferase
MRKPNPLIIVLQYAVGFAFTTTWCAALWAIYKLYGDNFIAAAVIFAVLQLAVIAVLAYLISYAWWRDKHKLELNRGQFTETNMSEEDETGS